MNRKENNTGKKGSREKQQTHAAEKQLCPAFGKCGGCQLLHLPYPEQLAYKQREMVKLLGGFHKPERIIGMENPFYYRNKIHSAFSTDRKGQIISGIYEENSHRVVPVTHCLLENEKGSAIVDSVRKLVKSFRMKIYNEDTGYGLIRHIMVRVGASSGEIMVVIVTASPIFPAKRNFTNALLKLHPEITTIVQNVNERHTSMVLGTRNNVLYGKGYITDILCGKTFRISPNSFYQVNPVQTEKLYGKVIELAGFKGNEVVLDAYAGTGTIGMIASDHVKQVISVELNGEAVRDAMVGAKENKIPNIIFYNEDAGEFMTKLADSGENIDVVITDPPRSGCSPEFLQSLFRLAPQKVIYVSCNPETLARDLGIFKKNGYETERIQPVDMFCFTEGVETVVRLSLKKMQRK